MRPTRWGSRPDVVHCHLPDAVISGAGASIVERIPFIIHEHQTQRFHSWKIQLMYHLIRPFASLSICFAGSIEKDTFGTSYVLKTPPESLDRKTYTIHNGIDTERVRTLSAHNDRSAKRRQLGYTDKDIVITSVARFVGWKGHRLLLEAFASVLERVPHTRLLIAGEGPLLEELRARAIELGLQNSVQMPGVRDDIYEILLASDISSLAFLYPENAQGEAVGIAGFEAMACGLPIVIADYAGASEYTQEGKNGIVVKHNDKAALAEALVHLAQDPLLRERMGHAAREYVSHNLDWENIIRVYERIYCIIAHI